MGIGGKIILPVIIGILILGVIGFENSFLLGQAYADFTLFEDDFNRPDNTALGGFWVVEELGVNSLGIQNNKMIWNADNAADSPFAEHGFLLQKSIAEATFTVSMEINIDQGSESTYEWWFQLGDGSLMGNPTNDVDGVAVSIKTGGDGETGTNAEEFVAVNGLSFIELTGGNVVHGTIELFISVDMSSKTYDVTISGPGVAGGPHITNNINFENSVDIDTIRFWMDGLQDDNFNSEETIDDLIITSTGGTAPPGMTGSITLSKFNYPVPFGDFGNFAISTSTTPDGRSLFPVHQGAMDAVAGLQAGETLGQGILQLQIGIIDTDLDLSLVTEDVLSTSVQVFADNCTGVSTPVASCVGVDTAEVGPIKIIVSRGSSVMVLGYAGGPSVVPGLIDVGDDNPELARQFGPITEVAPDGGVFVFKIPILYTDGPNSTDCPNTTSFDSLIDGGTAETDRFDTASAIGENYCIKQNDFIKVLYTDQLDDSGGQSTIQSNVGFNLVGPFIQTDKTVVASGMDLVLTLLDVDLDLDEDNAETIPLDVIQWDSLSATLTIGPLGGEPLAFDPEPSTFRETGDKTGTYQVIIEIPTSLNGNSLQEGEVITLSFQDWGHATSDYVGVGSFGDPVPKVASVQITMFDSTPTTVTGPVINAFIERNGFEIIVPLGVLVEPDLFPKVLVPTGIVEGDTVTLKVNGANFTPFFSKVLTLDDIIAEEISFTVSAGQLGADGPKSILYIVTSPNGNIKFLSGQLELTLVGGVRDQLLVKCTASPVLYQPGVQTTILAEAVDGLGDAVVADRLEIWIDDPFLPLASHNFGASTLSHSVIFTGSDFSYGCRAEKGGIDSFSGWKLVFIPPFPMKAIPIQYTGAQENSLDIIFIADEFSYTSSSDPNFLNDVSTAIDVFLAEPTYLLNQDKINYWLAGDTGQAFRNAENRCILVPPAFWDIFYPYVDAGAILHTTTFQDCAYMWNRIFSSSPDNRVLLHEAGHMPFGLSDEYLSANHFVPDPFPNLYETQADCDNDPFNSDKTCRMFTSTNLRTFGKPLFTSDPSSDDIMLDVGEFRPLDLRRTNWFFDQCDIGMC